MGCSSSSAAGATTDEVKLTKAATAAANPELDAKWPAYEAKMKSEGLSEAAMAAFKYNFGVLTSGANLMIPESTVSPVDSLPDYDALTKEDPTLLKTTVMVKLNGGLGTGMGLEKAKSLLDLKDGNTFLDFIAKQVTDVRRQRLEPAPPPHPYSLLFLWHRPRH
jgi:UDP-N-acetylglucosamine pyrophosphorylase